MNRKIHPDPNLQKKLEENKEMKIPMMLMRKQHEFNLQIFEKQAELTRDMQDEHAKLLKKLSWRTSISTILAVIIGALLGLYIECSDPKQSSQPQLKPTTMPIETQNTLVRPSPHEKETNKAIKSSAQEESSLKNLKP